MKNEKWVMVGTVLSESTYNKAYEICKEHNTDISELIETLINSLVKGDLKITNNILGEKKND